MQMVFDAEGLTSGEKAILLAYCNFTDPHGYCWPGVERIADMTAYSDRGIKKIRKALIERGLLATSSRVNAQGVRTTNITRVNLDKLASMRMPEKTYKDNVVHELEFTETTPDQPKGTEDTDPGQPKCTEFPDPVNTVPRKDGAHSSPYPSGEPSLEPSSSSARVEDVIDVEPTPAPKKKTKPLSKDQEREQAKTLIAARLPDSTDTEREAIIDLVYAEAAAKGRKIGFITTYIGGRPDALLEQDLAQVRGHQPPVPRSGGYRPYKNPENQDVYDEALL